MNVEALLKEAYKVYQPKLQGRCLTEEDIGCVLDETLGQKQRKMLVKHIISCTPCAERLKEHLSISEAMESMPLLEVPRHVIERAQSIVPGEVCS